MIYNILLIINTNTNFSQKKGLDLSLDLGLDIQTDLPIVTLSPQDISLIPEPESQPQPPKKGRGAHKFNAKIVECFDLEGNLLNVFPSCAEAAKIMDATPVEISQCCKGVKDNIRGFRYKYKNEDVPKKSSLIPKRGYVIEAVDAMSVQPEPELVLGSRSSRASRGIIEQVKFIESASTRKRFLDPKEALPRKWTKVTMKVGHIFVPTWVPNSNDLNPILNPNKSITTKSKAKRKR